MHIHTQTHFSTIQQIIPSTQLILNLLFSSTTIDKLSNNKILSTPQQSLSILDETNYHQFEKYLILWIKFENWTIKFISTTLV